MRPVDIDFSGIRPMPPAGALWLFAAGALLCMSAMWRFSDVNLLEVQAAGDVDRVRKVFVARRPPSAPAVALPEAQVQAINKAIVQLNLPWQSLFQSVERIKPQNIALIGLEPDGSKRILRIQAETKDATDMLDFVRMLREQPQFSDAVLVKHEINSQDPNQPVRFSVEAVWKENL